jgi:hypothetical protein
MKPQTPSYKPYGSTERAFDFTVVASVQSRPRLTPDEWSSSSLTTSAAVIFADCHPHDFQIQCSNIIIGRSKGVCVIAPTGNGKSPAMVNILHAESFKVVLSAIYIDESHLVHECLLAARILSPSS